MQSPIKLILPILAITIAIFSVIIPLYPFVERVETRPSTILNPYTEVVTGESTFIDEQTYTSKYYQTIMKTEITVLKEVITTLKAGGYSAKGTLNLPSVEIGDIITVEASSHIIIQIIDSSGTIVATSDNGELSYVIEETNNYKIVFQNENTKEKGEIFIGVARAIATSSKTNEYSTTYKQAITITEEYTATTSQTSTAYTYKTIVKPVSLSKRLWISAALLIVALSIAVASVILWRIEPRVEISPPYTEPQYSIIQLSSNFFKK